MEKTNYSLVKILAGLIFTMFMMLCVLSCDKIDNPVRFYGGGSSSVQQAIATVINVTGADPAEVTAALQAIVTDEAVAAAAAKGEPIKVTVAGSGVSTDATDQTITIPQANGANIEITFAAAPTGTGTNPLEFTASSGAAAASSAAKNLLTIDMPTANGLVITIELPQTTVTLTTNGTTVYKEVTAKTATSTLIVDKGVKVEKLVLDGGSILVNEGGEIETICMKAKGDDCALTVGSYWASYGWGDPNTYGEGGEIKTSEINPVGNPTYYIPKNVRVEKGDYSYIFVGTNGPDNECFEKLTIGDGLTTGVDNTRAKIIEGEGTSAKLSTRGWGEGNFESHFSLFTQKVKNLAIAPEGTYTGSYILVINYLGGIEGYDGHNGGTFTFEDCSFPAGTKFILATKSMTTHYYAFDNSWNLHRSQDKNEVLTGAGVADNEVSPWTTGGYWTQEEPGYGYYTALKPTLVFKNCKIGGADIPNETGLIHEIWGNHNQNYKIIINSAEYDHNM